MKTNTRYTIASAKAVELFHKAAHNIPAYKDFLSRESIVPQKIKTFKDFKNVPPVDKDNYLRQYPLKDLCWNGELFTNQIISVSSGSSGEPFFWPRGAEHHAEGAEIHEQIFTKILDIHQKSTLVVICFSMGTWIAGSFTLFSAMKIAEKNSNDLMVITPGIDKKDAIRAISKLAHNFDQIIIAGYPPFVRDIVLEGQEHIQWTDHVIKFLFAGESFSEDWRSHMAELVGATNIQKFSVNIYGTADAAIIGHETPLSVNIRQAVASDLQTSRQVFGTDIQPTLVNFYPQKRFIEEVNEELVFTTNSGIPLIRYNIHDKGKVFTDFEELATELGPRLNEISPRHIQDWSDLPYVTINGRKDFTATIYAVNIYPENIKAGLLDNTIARQTTGKFSMITKTTPQQDQYLEVVVELAPNSTPNESTSVLIKRAVTDRLVELNAEYRKLRTAIGNKADLHIILKPYGDSDFFSGTVKHSWLKRGE
ncbi:TPA: phenylacetate--CoA ligase family protein [Candidatus Saccharibacteria bacterium]|nr:phenylacetate--CoA ligase family protein [Candidatus Saccharibacteria bacterium]HIO88031.1 phenylacetate--CoA ligase family protein [Candidatus Saccharibacteria bacterium]